MSAAKAIPSKEQVEAEVEQQFGGRYRWTAQQMVAGKDLSGKLVMVTGGTSGIGEETVMALAGAGGRVVVPARSKAKGDALLTRCSGLKGKVLVWEGMDLTSLRSVKAIVTRAASEPAPFDIVINNAGVMALAEYSETTDGFETQIQVNYLAPIALIRGLLDSNCVAPTGRIIIVSSMAQRAVLAMGGYAHDRINWNNKEAYNKWQSYCTAKGIISMYAAYLGRRLADKGSRVTVNSLHPGAIMTGLLSDVPKEEQVQNGWVSEDGVAHPGCKDVAQGAATTVYAAVSEEMEGVTGCYLENCKVTPKGHNAPPDTPVYLAYGVSDYVMDTDLQEGLMKLTDDKLAPYGVRATL
eukprot:TRINITY_DN3987_c0_g3_i1.p1 TRINITY_DN3987_c0_g3~~TRINITY_DN3987_c0_g3_i1.p1  ORF type:complete len:353 (+),score=144.55 TRINITY_DN3987_c0_g3_i1:47-1105(+)